MWARIVKVVLMLTPTILPSDEEMFPHFVKRSVNATNMIPKTDQKNMERSQFLPRPSLSITLTCSLVFPSFSHSFQIPISPHRWCGTMTKIDRGAGSWGKRWIFKVGHPSRPFPCFPLSMSSSPWGLDLLLLLCCDFKCFCVRVCVGVRLVVLYWHSKASVVRRWHLAVSMQH